MSEALYRKYRPQVFSDVVGQDSIVRTLQNAISQNKVSHAYLFCGPRGTGKTTMARLLSKAMLCTDGGAGVDGAGAQANGADASASVVSANTKPHISPTPNPCGKCEDCTLIAAGNHPDVYELDAASRTGVENVREEIIGRVQFAPTRGASKIYIIDEVHMLSTAAFNALLKTLEEPPSHVVFVLCTTDPQKVPETILSRCQRFDFKRIGQESMVSKLGAVCVAEGVQFEGDALELVAHRANGGMRDALTALEQLIAFSGDNITLAMAQDMLGGLNTSDIATFAEAVGGRDVPSCFTLIGALVDAGADLSQFANDFAEYLRGMYVMSAGVDVSVGVDAAMRTQMKDQLPNFGRDRLLHDLCILGDLIQELKTSTNARLAFEIAAVRLARPETDLTLESLAERVEALEAGGAHVVNASAVVQPAQQRTNVQASQPQNSQTDVDLGSRTNDLVPQEQHPQQFDNEEPSKNPSEPSQQPKQAQASSQSVGQVAENSVRSQSSEQTISNPTPLQSDEQVASNSAMSQVNEHPNNNTGATSSATQSNPWESMAGDQALLQRTWNRIHATLKDISMPHAAFFLSVSVTYSQADKMLEIQFPSESDFIFKKAQEPNIHNELSQAVERVMGVSAPFKIVKQQSTTSSVLESAPASSANMSQAQPSFTNTPASMQAQPLSAPVQSSVGSSPASASSQPAPSVTSASPAPTPDEETQEYAQVPIEAYEQDFAYVDTQDQDRDSAFLDGVPSAPSSNFRQREPQAELHEQPQTQPQAQPQAQPHVQSQPQTQQAQNTSAHEQTTDASADTAWRENVTRVFGDVPIEKIE